TTTAASRSPGRICASRGARQFSLPKNSLLKLSRFANADQGGRSNAIPTAEWIGQFRERSQVHPSGSGLTSSPHERQTIALGRMSDSHLGQGGLFSATPCLGQALEDASECRLMVLL